MIQIVLYKRYYVTKIKRMYGCTSMSSKNERS